jgi:hypothetical protein
MGGKEEDELGLKLEFRIEESEYEAVENLAQSVRYVSRA